MSYTIYIDESGHSGAGEDEAQPTLVLAGVWVPKTQETTLRAEIADLRRARRVQMPNLKGSELIVRPRGQAFLRDLFDVLARRNVLVTPVAVHKLYMAAAILIEDATDYVYNAHFSVGWISARDTKHILADYIFDVTAPELLGRFLELRRANDFVGCATIAREIVHNAASASKAEPFGRVISRMIDTDFADAASHGIGLTPIRHSPNQTALQIMLNLADQCAEDLGALGCSLVHDQQVEFGEEIAFRANLAMKTQTTEEERRQIAPMRLPTKHLADLRFAKSKLELGIQLADCAAAAVRTAADIPERAPEAKTALASWLRTCGGGHFPYAFGPRRWCARTNQRLLTGIAA